MVKVTRLNGKEFFVNHDLIEFIEETPDTVVTLTTGKRIVVVESADEIIERIVLFRRASLEALPKITPKT